MSNEYIELPVVNIFIDPPASATAPGAVGQVAFDASYLYICVAEDTWVRALLGTWQYMKNFKQLHRTSISINSNPANR